MHFKIWYKFTSLYTHQQYMRLPVSAYGQKYHQFFCFFFPSERWQNNFSLFVSFFGLFLLVHLSLWLCSFSYWFIRTHYIFKKRAIYDINQKYFSHYLLIFGCCSLYFFAMEDILPFLGSQIPTCVWCLSYGLSLQKVFFINEHII